MFVCGGATICWIVCCGVVIVRRKLPELRRQALRERAGVDEEAAAAAWPRAAAAGRRAAPGAAGAPPGGCRAAPGAAAARRSAGAAALLDRLRMQPWTFAARPR